MMKSALYTALALGFLSLSLPAHAAGEGTAVGVDPDAVARINSADRILVAGTDISVGETIVTGSAGQVQILFDDQTKLVVGPGSSLLIETYLMAGNNTAEKLTINALGGSFRFITGGSPKPAYSINTPTAAIAVRGTEFDLLVAPRSTSVLIYEGALQLCANGGSCTELTERCDLGTVSGGTTATLPLADAAHKPIAQQFRYARFQSKLLDPFHVDGAIFCTEAKPESSKLLVDTSGGTIGRTTLPPPDGEPQPRDP